MSDLTLKQVVAWANENNRVVVDSAYLNKLTKRAIDAEEAVRLRDVNDNGLFMEAFKATTRARAIEQRNTVLEEGGRALVAANTKHFDAARAAEQRAEAAEKERDGWQRKADADVLTVSELAGKLRTVAQRNIALEGTLRKIERKTHIPPKPPRIKLSGWYSVIADVNDHARAALHDEEQPPMSAEELMAEMKKANPSTRPPEEK